MAVGIVLVVLIVLFQVITSFWYNYLGTCAFTIMNLTGLFFPPLKLLILCHNYCFELLTGNEASSYWSKKFSCYLYVLDFCEYHTYCFEVIVVSLIFSVRLHYFDVSRLVSDRFCSVTCHVCCAQCLRRWVSARTCTILYVSPMWLVLKPIYRLRKLECTIASWFSIRSLSVPLGWSMVVTYLSPYPTEANMTLCQPFKLVVVMLCQFLYIYHHFLVKSIISDVLSDLNEISGCSLLHMYV